MGFEKTLFANANHLIVGKGKGKNGGRQKGQNFRPNAAMTTGLLIFLRKEKGCRGKDRELRKVVETY